MDQNIVLATPVEAPRGFFSARIDEKGRLKLPAALREYVAGFGVRKVFITSLDRRLARLYPIAIWRSNEKFFEEYTEDPKVAQDIAFNANDLGGDSEMDDQGRVLVPQELRRTLGIENQPVWLQVYQGAVHIYGQQAHEARREMASQNTEDKLDKLTGKGLK